MDDIKVEEIKDKQGELVGKIVDFEEGKAIFNDEGTVIITDNQVYKDGEVIGNIINTRKGKVFLNVKQFEDYQAFKGFKRKEKRKKALKRKIFLITGGIALVGMIVAGVKRCSKKTPTGGIIIPTPTVTEAPIEEEVTPTVTPNVNLDECEVRLIDYQIKPGESLESIVRGFYEKEIDKYNFNEEKSEEYRVIDKIEDIISDVNGIEDKNKIKANDYIKILNPEEVNEESMYVIFYERSTYERENDVLKFKKNHVYTEKDETKDGAYQREGYDYWIKGETYSKIVGDDYITNSYDYVMGPNFNLDKFVEATYKESLLAIGIPEGELGRYYEHLKTSIYNLNPMLPTYMDSKMTAGKTITVVPPEIVKSDKYLIVLIEQPNKLDDDKLSYYAGSVLQFINYVDDEIDNTR